MARGNTSLESRLDRLLAARARIAALPRGERLSSRPMAEALGVSWQTLREWCDEFGELFEWGAAIRGGNGIEWSFDPALTATILVMWLRLRIAGQSARSGKTAADAGLVLAPNQPAPSMAEVKDQVNLTLAVVSATEKQRGYALAAEVAAFVEGYNEAVVSGILGVRTKADPNGRLPAAVRGRVDELLRSLALSVHQRAERYVSEVSAGLQQGGTGRAGEPAVGAQLLPPPRRHRRGAARAAAPT